MIIPSNYEKSETIDISTCMLMEVCLIIIPYSMFSICAYVKKKRRGRGGWYNTSQPVSATRVMSLFRVMPMFQSLRIAFRHIGILPLFHETNACRVVLLYLCHFRNSAQT